MKISKVIYNLLVITLIAVGIFIVYKNEFSHDKYKKGTVNGNT